MLTIPGLMSTLTSALHSSPFPSPLGATNPPAGRYEGAILGLAALGPYAVRQTIWGTNGDGLQRIDVLAGKLYPGEKEAKRGRVGVMKAAMVSLGFIELERKSSRRKSSRRFVHLTIPIAHVTESTRRSDAPKTTRIYTKTTISRRYCRCVRPILRCRSRQETMGRIRIDEIEVRGRIYR